MPHLFARSRRRIHDSLAFRSELAYRHAFSMLPLFGREQRRVDDGLSYLTLVGKAQLPILRASLWSLLKASVELPRLIVTCDAALTKPELAKAMQGWPGPFEMWSAEELRVFSRDNLPAEIDTLCRKHVYGLKATAIMRASLAGPTIYADTDVLWFRPPRELFSPSDLDGRLLLRLQQDRQMSYDARLVDKWPFLRDQPHYCAGVLAAHGDFAPAFRQIAPPDIERIYETAGQFTEQTTFAALQRTIGLPPLTAEDAYLSWDDQLTLRPTFFGKPWVLRHYVGLVRHLFWRDAFFLYWRRS